jgi:hypothetical protein
MVEVVVDRGVGGGKLLQGPYISELRHRPLSSSERLVGILGSIVEPTDALLIGGIADYRHRRAVRPKPVGHNGLRLAIAFHRALQELQRSPTIPNALLQTLPAPRLRDPPLAIGNESRH